MKLEWARVETGGSRRNYEGPRPQQNRRAMDEEGLLISRGPRMEGDGEDSVYPGGADVSSDRGKGGDPGVSGGAGATKNKEVAEGREEPHGADRM